MFDPLTKAQCRQLRDTGRRVLRAIDPGDPFLSGQPISSVVSSELPA